MAEGAAFPIGLAFKHSGGQSRAGITCALCHSAVDPESRKVIHGAVNTDIQFAKMAAFGENSAGLFIHTGIDLDKIPRDQDRTVRASDGSQVALPNIAAMEAAVEFEQLHLIPGTNNTSPDLTADPGQIPDSFTFGEHPFGWAGQRMAGPFRGLTSLNNTVHAIGSDPASNWESAATLIGMDPEVYLAIILQNAASEQLRWSPDSGLKPSEFLQQAKHNPGPGLNYTVKLPTYPHRSMISTLGVAAVSPDVPFWGKMNAMSAWQNHLIPPVNPISLPLDRAKEGRRIFVSAGCAECHSGEVLTNNRIIPLEEIKTSAARVERPIPLGPLVNAQVYAFDTPIPLPSDPKVLDVPTDHLDPEQIELAYGDQNGYATPGLLGLYWSPPYLHDSSIAVGPQGELGMANTLMQSIRPRSTPKPPGARRQATARENHSSKRRLFAPSPPARYRRRPRILGG